VKDRTVVGWAVGLAFFGLAASCIDSPDDRAVAPDDRVVSASTSTTTSSVVTATVLTTTTTTTVATTIEDVEPAGTTVTRVVDGDTLDVASGERVRLIGIDTPEVYGEVECYGPEATQRAIDLASLQHVRLETDPSQDRYDRYGRLLAYVWLDDGRMLNEILVAEGLAREYLFREPYRYRDRFLVAQGIARIEGHGLWGAC
jgi:micrococcal nuclease